MRKGLFMLSCLMLAFCVSGCGYIKLTEKEKDQLAEYMAGKILDYDRHYEDSLIMETPEPQEPVESEAPQETKEPLPTKEPEVETELPEKEPQESQEEKVSDDLNTVFNQKGIKLSYGGFAECSSYPENPGEEYFVVEAGLGKSLWVLEFNLLNTSDSDINISLLDSAVKYQLVFEDGSTISPLKSWLIDDLQFFEGRIPKGKKLKSHLVFEVENGVKKDNVHFAIYEGEKRAEISNVLK